MSGDCPICSAGDVVRVPEAWGVRGQPVTPWDDGGWRCRSCGLSAPAAVWRAIAPEAQNKALREALAGFASAVESATKAFEARGKGGMQAGTYQGDFASAPPSVLRELAWWGRHFRAALNTKAQE